MIQRILEHLWVFWGFVLAIAMLYVGAALRIRREQTMRRRAVTDRRKLARPSGERRWTKRPLPMKTPPEHRPVA